MKRPAQLLASLLKKHKLTIAFAESMTCGLAAHMMGNLPGASEFLQGGIVCYAEEVKTHLLQVGQDIIDKNTAESQKVTDVLAINLQKRIRADIHVAITGLAAPGGSESKSKPVGTVFFSVIFHDKIHRLKMQFEGSPLQIKHKACSALFSHISGILKK